MYLMMAFGMTFLLLMLSVQQGVFIGYALTAGLLMFSALAVKRGNRLSAVLGSMMNGGRKSLVVIRIFVLIGVVIAAWMEAGTVPAIVYYGLELLSPETFVLAAFIISAFVSFLIGSSVGTSGTIGIALILIARSGGVNTAAAAGAVIAGAYFGDRCSPMSSSANLVSAVTKTDIYVNVKNMFRTCVFPLMITLVFYFIVSAMFPLNASDNAIGEEIFSSFYVGLPVMLPALIIIVFSIFRVNVKYSMLFSIIAAILLGLVFQGETLKASAGYVIFGYSMDISDPLYPIIRGGGAVSMVRTSIILFIASALAGLIGDTKMLNIVEAVTEKANSRYEIFRNVLVTSLFTSAIGCCQAFTVMMTDVLNAKAYDRNNLDGYSRAVDLENTSVLVSALIPWNLSLLLPMTILGADYSCLPYLAYIYILPAWNLIYLWAKEKLPYGIIKLYSK
ncbi:MAG: sodium:proton antiporter [Firmicutes bacterium]|nr:sodium:proton antiporter [Bacillota bacterium]